LLIGEWLSVYGRGYTHRDAQHYRKVDDREKDLIEVTKYEAKIITEPNEKGKPGEKGTAKIYARALDNICTAMKGYRATRCFGFNWPEGRKRERGESRIVEDYELWHYDLKSRDWVIAEHESTLTAYVPPAALESLLNCHIDAKSE
jgi:hypothetical protein